MNTHQPPASTRRYNFLTLLVASLFSIVAAYGVMPGAAYSPAAGGDDDKVQSPTKLAKPSASEDIEKDFNDDDLKAKEEKPRGKWSTGLLFDKSQFYDPSVPVVVEAIQSLSGGGKYFGVAKIKRVVISNRGPKTVSSVQLRWTITTLQDRQRVLSADTAPFATAWVEPEKSQTVEIPALYYHRMLKTLAKNGELYGEFVITIGVQEARFADGSHWRRQEPVSHLKFLYLAPPPGHPFPTIASLAAGIIPPRPDPALKRDTFKSCEAQPRLAASAVLFALFQVETCHDNMAPVEADGKQSCGLPSPNTTCMATCSSTGHCIAWVRSQPCNTPTPPPTPTPTPSPGPRPCPSPKPADCCVALTPVGTGVTQDCYWVFQLGEPGTPMGGGCIAANDDGSCPSGYSPSLQGQGICCPQTAGLGGDGGDDMADCMNKQGWRWNFDTGRCECREEWGCVHSPVIVDVAGDGFALTGAEGGVPFDLDSDGAPERLAWTAAGSDDAWLALDRDGDGRIRDGRELFGNFTPQPPSSEPNGFLALAEFDRAEKGGNGDGVIDARDAVFARLRLWRDADHDGVSQPGELHGLAALDVIRLSLDYKESGRADEHGNRFRYRAKVEDGRGARAGRWAWDVFLVSAP